MKKLLFLMMLLLNCSLYAQDTSKWSFGVEYAIDEISVADEMDGRGFLATVRDEEGYAVKFDKDNFSLGFTTRYGFSEKLGLATGILYSNKDFTGTYDCRVCDFLSSPETIEQRFIVVPVALEYSFLPGKFQPVVTAGIRNNVEIKNDLESMSNGYFLGAFAGASVQYELINNLNLGAGYK